MTSADQKVIIIGGDAAGMSAAARISRLSPGIEVKVYEKSPHISYASCGIPAFISREIKSSDRLLVLTPEKAQEKYGIKVYTRHEVFALRPEKRLIAVRDIESGQIREESYTHLLIATGAHAHLPELPGIRLPGVFTLRNLQDGIKLKNYLSTHSINTAIVVGSGFIGLEMATAFSTLGLKVLLIERASLLAPAFEPEISRQIESLLKSAGISIITGAQISAIEGPEETGVTGVKADLQTFRGELVLWATGIIPESHLARESGLRLWKNGAILTDHRMQTSRSKVYAAGDCATYKCAITGKDRYLPLASPASKAARIAADNICGRINRYSGFVGTYITRFFDYTLASCGLGLQQAREAGFRAQKANISAPTIAPYINSRKNLELVLIYDQDNGRILGAQYLSSQSYDLRINAFALAIRKKATLKELANLDLAYAPHYSTVHDPINIAAISALKNNQKGDTYDR